jgi:hypothetical protein
MLVTSLIQYQNNGLLARHITLISIKSLTSQVRYRRHIYLSPCLPKLTSKWRTGTLLTVFCTGKPALKCTVHVLYTEPCIN